ncbi:matrixin family metalloprotease [Hyalangium versicolor]|uniref:matrixin family metalloprotease n=1 Tax=Hyalangium versicolor TaxID=2861190 RepID=UPI001CCD3D8F|nr:matrixin family metalloprotease [Hyalangium versicolor]
MNRWMQWTAGLVLMVLSATASAQNAYDYLGYKMLNTRDYPFRYYIDARPAALTKVGIALSEVETATKAAFQSWEDVSCAYPDFAYAGPTTSNTSIDPNDVGNPYDTFNVSTVWVTSSSDKYYAMALQSGQVLSGTIPLTYAGYLYQCDIFLNAVTARWTTLPNTPASQELYDLQTVLTHEVGHCLGLGDAYYTNTAVMHPDFPLGGNRRVLDPQDVEEICSYYPENGAVGSPCSASDPCEGGLTCIPFKSPSGVTLYNYCSKSCPGVTNGECPNPFVCRTSNLIPSASKACLAVPGEAITQVGKPCSDSTDPGTDCGSARAICQGPVALPSGGTAWVEGYCTESCVGGSSANQCPGGSVCVELGANDRCLKTCRPGSGDCRDGYTCSPLPEGNVCVPSCYQNVDCNDGNSTAFICRTCDRVCIENKVSGRSVGDPCSTSDQCGPGQICFFMNSNAQGMCTQTCNTAQCSCPNDSSCKSVGPDRVCLKNCAAGTCTAPLVCNPVGSSNSLSTVCTPACRNDRDCPTGFECYAGRCEDPTYVPDAGCTLCNDGGTPPPPPPPQDGGTSNPGPSTPSGCGCGEAPASALVFLGVLALVLFARRQRSWPHR